MVSSDKCSMGVSHVNVIIVSNVCNNLNMPLFKTGSRVLGGSGFRVPGFRGPPSCARALSSSSHLCLRAQSCSLCTLPTRPRPCLPQARSATGARGRPRLTCHERLLDAISRPAQQHTTSHLHLLADGHGETCTNPQTSTYPSSASNPS